MGYAFAESEYSKELAKPCGFVLSSLSIAILLRRAVEYGHTWGAWRSRLAHQVVVLGVAGSNPVAPPNVNVSYSSTFAFGKRPVDDVYVWSCAKHDV